MPFQPQKDALEIGLGLMLRKKIMAKAMAFSRQSELELKMVNDLHQQTSNT